MTVAAKIVLCLVLLLPARPLLAQPQPAAKLPAPPALKSPVDTFRDLLAMTTREREAALADRPAESRERLLAKVREYRAMSPQERDLRLLATELRWWLLPLMRLSAEQRGAELTLVPTRFRTLVEDRLQAWDLLPPELQKAQLHNEDVAQLFTRLQGRTAQQREQYLKSLPTDRRQQLEAGLARWTAMSTEERRLTCEQFDRYFELTRREQARVLSQLSETEREQMEQTLQSFARLPREQRSICLRAFEKFTRLSPGERQQFLKNAERWEKMSPTERDAWRRLVKQVADFPPLPPEIQRLVPPLPPSFPATPQPSVTNGGG